MNDRTKKPVARVLKTLAVVVAVFLVTTGASCPDRQDCVSFNPGTISVQQIDGRWKVVDGSHWLFDFDTNEAEARRTYEIIRHYGMNQSCFVGRPDPSFEYLLISGDAPSGSFPGEDCVSLNPATVTVQEIGGRWKVVDGTHWLFDFDTNKAEAEETLQIIQRYGFTQSCFVGRPDASFSYMRK